MTEQEFARYLYDNCYEKVINNLSQKTSVELPLIKDFVQEAITEIWFLKKEGKLKHEDNLCNFVYKIARNKLFNDLKKNNKLQDLDKTIEKEITEKEPFELNLYSKHIIRRREMKAVFEKLVDELTFEKLVDEPISEELVEGLFFELGLDSKDDIWRRAMKAAFEKLGEPYKIPLKRFLINKENLKGSFYISINKKKLQDLLYDFFDKNQLKNLLGQYRQLNYEYYYSNNKSKLKNLSKKLNKYIKKNQSKNLLEEFDDFVKNQKDNCLKQLERNFWQELTRDSNSYKSTPANKKKYPK